VTEFSLFGFGYEGLPSEVDLWLSGAGEVERVASRIIAESEAKTRAALNKTKRPHPTTEAASLAFLLVAWHNKHGIPIPPIVMTALAHAMGLVSYAGGMYGTEVARSAVADEVKARIGIPISVSMAKLDAFMTASRLDGDGAAAGNIALKRDALAAVLGTSPRSIDAWRKEPSYQERVKVVRAWTRPGEPVPQDVDEQCDWIRRNVARQSLHGRHRA
jgi:hypothetical protein